MKRLIVPVKSFADLQRIKHLFKKRTGYNLMTPLEFQAYQRTLESKSIELKQRRHNEYEGNAQVQRWRTLTKDEKAEAAIDRSAKGIREFNDFKTGRDTTDDEARKKAVELAERAAKSN